MPVQLQYILLITDKTNAADMSSGVFAILITVARMIKIQNSLPIRPFFGNPAKSGSSQISSQLPVQLQYVLLNYG